MNSLIISFMIAYLVIFVIYEAQVSLLTKKIQKLERMMKDAIS